MTIRFGSVCSGIEAASVAWHPLGWQAAWLAEIEPFPSAVLAHHYPDVPNLGNMTLLPDRIASGEVEAPDLFCGGTPCQAFSVAGLRKSLDDARGNLSLVFCEIANAIDNVRRAGGKHPATIFWENVPGVLNTADNAFGCFLAGLAGEADPLVAPGGKWPNAGAVYGPQRTVAWRVLDAQYFGVAQRRRRVFVVASAREGFDPVEVLFEFDGLRRDTAPSREAGKVAPTIPARSLGGGGLGTDFDCDGGLISSPHAAISPALKARDGKGPSSDGDGDGDGAILVPMLSHATTQFGEIAGSLTARHDSSPCADRGMNVVAFDTTQITSKANYSNPKAGDPCHPLAAGAHVPAIAVRTANTSANGHGISEELAHTLDRAQGRAVAFAQNSRDEVRLMGGDGSIVGALAAEPGMKQTCYIAQPVAFSRKDYGGDATEDLLPTLRAMNHADSHANGGGQMAVAVSLRGREGGATAELGNEVGNCLRASGGGGDKAHVLAPVAYVGGIDNENNGFSMDAVCGPLMKDSPTGGGRPLPAVAFQSSQSGVRIGDTHATLDANNGPRRHNGALQGMQVRRLTPVECERLQGFPDGYTQIPWRKKAAEDCPDGPRYKALGNSWAVPNVRWIGTRIHNAIVRLEALREAA